MQHSYTQGETKFFARPADSQNIGSVHFHYKNGKLGANYIISYWQHLPWRQKICKLAICDDASRNLLYLSNLIGTTTCRCARMITS